MNSEVGHSRLTVKDFDYTLACLNGMVRESVVRHTHVGAQSRLDGLNVEEFMKDETRAADDRALFLKLRDTISGMFTRERFEKRLSSLREATEDRIEEPMKTIEVVKKRYQLTDGQQQGVLRHLIEGGDLSRYGLANAITRLAGDEKDYDKSHDLEELGGRIIELPRRDWKELAERRA